MRFSLPGLPLQIGVVALLVAVAGPVRGQRPSVGPLGTGEGSPQQRLAFTPLMADAAVLPAGSFSVEFRAGHANIFEHDSAASHLLYVDLERLMTTMAVRWAVTETLELGGSVSLATTGGGVLDGAVSGWHNFWGFPNADRDIYPANSYRQVIQRAGEAPIFDVPDRRTMALDDARVSGKWRAWQSGDGRSVVSLQGVVRFPGSPNAVAPELTDGAVMALGRVGVGAWYLHGMVGRSFHRVAPGLAGVLNEASTFVTVAAERSLGASVAALAQFEYQSAALSTFNVGEIDRNAFNLVLGLAGYMGDNWRWEAAFQEDLPAETPAIDFTLEIGLRRTW